MSIAGGVHRALERAATVGCRAVQLFTRNQARWAAPPIPEEDAERFQRLSPGFAAVLAHASYLINIASPDPPLFRRSTAALAEELKRCQLLGIPYLVLHPGFHMGSGQPAGMRRAAAGALEARTISPAPTVTLLLETTAGQGSALAGSFAELRDLLNAFFARGLRPGVCVDSCHVFAAGYDLRDRGGYERTWREFGQTVGMDHLKALHLNDSRGALGSHRDRHAHIGEGRIGPQGFFLLVNDHRLHGLPGVIETPKGPDLAEDRMNLTLLRSLRE